MMVILTDDDNVKAMMMMVMVSDANSISRFGMCFIFLFFKS